MPPTKDQQAQEYAEKKVEECVHVGYFSQSARRRIQKFDSYDMEQAFSDGYTAAEQSMWRSVEEELPEDNILAVVWCDSSAVLTDFCESGKWHYLGVRFWMPLPELPSLPDTNTEKE